MSTINAFLVVGVLVGMGAIATAQDPETTPELVTPLPLPQQVAAKEGWAHVAGARLWYWDTGGDGPIVVLVHPATGSGLIWGYQQPVFAKAGYRVIGYSRKHYAKSEITAENEIGSEVDDLHGLIASLKIDKFHAIGSAAGGGIVMQYAVKHPEKLQSMTIACSLGAVQEEKYQRACAELRPASFNNLPVELRELGPCYRAADPEGTRRWLELARNAHAGREKRSSPADAVTLTWDKLTAAKVPTLLLGGDADLYLPPPLLKYCHDRMPGSAMVIIDGAGHSAYWEQPEIFNRTVLEFIRRHAR